MPAKGQKKRKGSIYRPGLVNLPGIGKIDDLTKKPIKRKDHLWTPPKKKGKK